MQKTIICLANSKKHGDSCVAGIELLDGTLGSWIRPLGRRDGHGISSAEQVLPDGEIPRVLDVITIGVSEHVPDGCQTENWLLDDGVRWERVDTWAYCDLSALVDAPSTLWTNASSSSVGTRDRVSVDDLGKHRRSIMLVEVDEPVVVVSRNPWSQSVEVRLSFHYLGVEHELKITDRIYKATYLGQGVGRYPLSRGTLATVSLAEVYAAPTPGADAYSYKVVAAIIEPEQ